MQCAEIHQETSGCPQEIKQTDGWKFCPTCGRLAAHLVAPEAVTLNGDASRAGKSLIALRNLGPNSVQATVSLSGAPDGVRLTSGPRRNLVLPPRQSAQVEIELPPFATSARNLATLLIEAGDGPRGPEQGPWDEPKPRRLRVPLSIEVAAPAAVAAVQTIALFRDGISERSIKLHNTGQRDAEVVEIREPEGYEVSPRHGTIPAGESLEFKVQYRPRPQATGGDSEIQPLVFKLGDGETRTVSLHRTRGGGIQRIPKAVIGIDFGTAFTTVAFREYRRVPGMDDPVTFLRLPDEPDPRRFRTRLWLGLNREFRFASDATHRYEAGQGSGFLFREIKTLLRTINRDFIYPSDDDKRDAAISYVTRLYGENWPQALVTEYLKWLYQTLILPELTQRFGDAVPYVRYLFSLPVLDFNPGGVHPIYDRQRAQMEACVAGAGFPMDSVDFQFEPVCALMGLLHPQDGPDWPRLATQKSPLQTGDAIALFDSGGGTTDVVLMKATVDSGKVTLDVERCLGVGSETETFGGEVVTSSLLQAVADPRSVKMEAGDEPWFEGALSTQHVFGEDVAGRDMELRDAAEELKLELALNDGVSRGDVDIRGDLLYYLVERYLASLTRALPERVFDQTPQDKTRYYLCVGGNTSLPVFQRWVERHMGDYNPNSGGRRLRLPEDYRKLMIAYGAVWVWDARIRNVVPYGLSVEAHETPLLTLAPNTSEEAFPSTETLTIPARETLDCRVLATLGAQSYQVDAGTVYNPYDEELKVDLRTDVQHGMVHVLFKMGDHADYLPLINYRL